MKKRIYLSLLILLAITVTKMHAATIEWDGGAGTNNFSDADNWDTNTVPGSSDYAYIGIAATIELSGTVTIERFRMNHASISFTIMSGASLTVDGTTSDGFRVDLGTVTNNGTLISQNIGNGSSDNGIDLRSTFHNNGTVTVNGSTDDGVVVYDGAIFNNNTGATLTINNAGDFGIYIDGGDRSTFKNDGLIVINSAPDDALRIEKATFNNNASGTIDVNTPGDLGISILDSGILNNFGNIDVSGATARYGIETYDNGTSATLNNMNGGIINISSTAQDGLFIGVNTTFNNDGTVIVTDAANSIDIHREPGSTYVNTSNAIYAPGNSPGTLNIEGDFEFGGATYNCEINGITPNTQYDVIAISGAATLTGASTNVDWGAFAPVAGQSFTVLTAGSISGTFTSVSIPPISGISFTTTYSATDVVISASMVLPVELSRFTAKAIADNKVELIWETESEVNNNGFEIQRSLTGADWEVLAFVKGKGTSSVQESYRFVDNYAQQGENYYRLKQMDFDGRYEYSAIKSIRLRSTAITQYTISPNPSMDGQLVMKIDNGGDLSYKIKVYSVSGALMYEGTGNEKTKQFDFTDFPKGMFYFQFINETQIKTTSFILN